VNEVAIYEAPTPVEVTRYAGGVAEELARVVKQRGLSKVIQGKEYLTAEAWGAAGEMMDLSVKLDEPQPFTDSTGKRGYSCRASLYRPDGRELSSAVAICTRSERRWASADDYALYSMAQTRAIGKAYRSRLSFIAVLAGYEPTPAEEMPHDAGVTAPVAGTGASADASRVVEADILPAPTAAVTSDAPDSPPRPTGESVVAALAGSQPRINAAQQKELAAAAKKAKVTWPSLQAWMASQGIGKFDSQARLTVDAWNRCIGFCNEQTWEDEVAKASMESTPAELALEAEKQSS
jgi:hypothetical protein